MSARTFWAATFLAAAAAACTGERCGDEAPPPAQSGPQTIPTGSGVLRPSVITIPGPTTAAPSSSAGSH